MFNRMKVLVACEESQAVCKAFRERGHEAYSCDIIECSGGHPEWHIKGDVLPLLNGYKAFYTTDGKYHDDVLVDTWDMIIAFPPCTHLAVSGCNPLSHKQVVFAKLSPNIHGCILCVDGLGRLYFSARSGKCCGM